MDFKFIFGTLLAALISVSECKERRALGGFIKDYDQLNYNSVTIHRRHRRAVSTNNHFELELTSHGKPLRLRLQRDTSLFTDDAKIQSASGKPIDFDEDSLVVGSVKGDKRSHVFGALNNGVFQGKISTADEEYYVDPAELYFDKAKDFHSVIYKSKDVEFDGANRMPGKVPDLRDEGVARKQLATKRANKRTRRATSEEINRSHCVLSLYADSYFVKLFDNKPSNAIYQISQQVRAVRAIYEQSFRSPDYYPNKGLSFRVKNMVVYDPETDSGKEPWKQVAPNNIGIDTLLDIFSSSPFDHKDICEAFLFTDRDFEGGILGLAWIGEPNKAGGICDKQRDLGNQKYKSYNTGVVTMKLYGKFTPPKVSEVTFAHELGHGFGSQHDPDNKDCAPGGTKGNYIMYARATSGDRYNNNKFSNCSLKSIRSNVDSKRERSEYNFCFISADKPICGNKYVEKGEQCDCGDSTTCTEKCCYPAGDPNECKLRPGVDCSPSQGPCCGQSCVHLANNICRNETDCTEITRCGGISYSCPDPTPKPDNTSECAGGLKVCMSGECKLSVCNKFGLEECRCMKEGEECDLCCQQPSKPGTCQSAKNLAVIPAALKEVKMVAGTPCADMHGYCDVFHVCRKVDMEGPLLRLSKKFLSVEGLKETVQKYWWAILLGVLALLALIFVMVKLCAVYTPSDNPRKRPAKTLPGKKKKNPRGQEGTEMLSRA